MLYQVMRGSKRTLLLNLKIRRRKYDSVSLLVTRHNPEFIYFLLPFFFSNVSDYIYWSVRLRLDGSDFKFINIDLRKIKIYIEI